MATLADIRRAASGNVYTGTDDTTPAGTFYSTTMMVGILTHYLLVGDPGDDNAPIIGRIETLGGGFVAITGCGIKGGIQLFRDDITDSATAFRAMRSLKSGRLIIHRETTALNYHNRKVQLPAGDYEIVAAERQIAGMTYFVGPRGYVWHIAADNPRVSVV